jgi:hypothetical protein
MGGGSEGARVVSTSFQVVADCNPESAGDIRRSRSIKPVSLATPHSMDFTTGRPSYGNKISLDGLRSRWINPFWWACCTVLATGRSGAVTIAIRITLRRRGPVYELIRWY